VARADITLSRSNDDLNIAICGSSDRLIVKYHFQADATSGYRIDRIAFDDGTYLDLAAISAAVRTATESGDSLWGTASADTIAGLDGDDALNGLAGNDTLDGGPGVDTLAGGAGDDLLYGGMERDDLRGEDGTDQLFGQAGDDALSGGNGNDTLDGGAGNDSLDGGTGSDVYVFGRGYGRDTASGYDGTPGRVDAIRLLPGIAPTDVSLRRVDTALWLDINGTSDSIQVGSPFYSTGYQIDEIRFADGTVWKLPDMMAKLLQGTAGADKLTGYGTADQLVGGDGDDTLDGGLGNDALDGGASDDTAYYSANKSAVIVARSGPGTFTVTRGSEVDTLRGIEYLSFYGTRDALTMGDIAIDAPAPQWGQTLRAVNTLTNPQSLTITGTQWQVFSVGQWANIAGAVGTTYTTGQADIGKPVRVVVTYSDPVGTGLQAVSMPTQPVQANAGPQGQLLVSRLVPRVGQELAVDGAITDANGMASEMAYQWQGSADGASWSDIAGATGRTLGVGPTLMGLRLRAVARYADGAGQAEVVVSDATLPVPQVAVQEVSGTAGADQLVGTSQPDRLVAGGGDDMLDGGSNADHLLGGQGDDHYVVDNLGDTVVELAGEGMDRVSAGVSWTLGAHVEQLVLGGTAALDGTGNSLANTLTGNAGNNKLQGLGGDDILSGLGGDDTLVGADGNDVLAGGVGNDQLVGGAGGDTYVFNAADGMDTVVDSDGAPGALDAIQFGSGITAADIGFYRVADNLEMRLGAGTDRLVVKDWYLGVQNRIEQIGLADGTILTPEDAEGRVTLTATSLSTSTTESEAPMSGLHGIVRAVLGAGLDAVAPTDSFSTQVHALVSMVGSFSPTSGATVMRTERIQPVDMDRLAVSPY
jgi:Ca2+-binding RTX toxin-like protein